MLDKFKYGLTQLGLLITIAQSAQVRHNDDELPIYKFMHTWVNYFRW